MTVDKPDESWKGNVGVITTLFQKTKEISSDTKVVVCGPPVMYKFVLMALQEAEVPKEKSAKPSPPRRAKTAMPLEARIC